MPSPIQRLRLLGAYVASAWLLLVAANLVLGGHFDVAVRDVVMSVAAFTLARGLEVLTRKTAMTEGRTARIIAA